MISLLLLATSSGNGLNTTVLSILVSLIIGLFGGGSLVALLKVKVDKNQIVISAAQGAVIIQSGVIDDLQEELSRIKVNLTECLNELHKAEKEINLLNNSLYKAEHEIQVLQHQVTVLGGGR